MKNYWIKRKEDREKIVVKFTGTFQYADDSFSKHGRIYPVFVKDIMEEADIKFMEHVEKPLLEHVKKGFDRAGYYK